MTAILTKERYRLFDGERPLTQDAEAYEGLMEYHWDPTELHREYVVAPRSLT